MKKSILLSIGIVAALGASTSIYAYSAVEQSLETNVQDSSVSGTKPADPEHDVIENISPANELSAPLTPVTVDIENRSIDDLHIPLDLADRAMSLTNRIISSNPIKELVLATATDWGTNNEKRVIYALESGSEVQLFQADLSPNVSIDYFKNLSIYDPAEVSVIDIHGFQAVIEDGSPRKTVHLVTNEHVYIVVSVYEDVSLDYLIEVAKQIKVTEENTIQQKVEINATNGQEAIVSPDPDVQDNRVDLSQLPEGVEVRIPESFKDTAPADICSAQTSDTPDMRQLTPITAHEVGPGEFHFITRYQSLNGAEIIVNQVPIEGNTIETIGDFYREPTEVTDINGDTVVYVDGEFRKAAHLLMNDHLFNVSTTTGNLDDLMNVLKQIQEYQS
ncbi:hypothetical protein [Paenibacillus ihbetae]|uniref:DUF4367 domain-containing protein n=1 Tax=Paenibacillus ihbetae TaxID=1870820 RepID=A0ABX3JWQ0_9BACL|nr:hypothetical protein [Paenibacillus ihbetae]OOC62006.1 hypothetical protein BBD40_09145 [Paenibacillus ihbetae]